MKLRWSSALSIVLLAVFSTTLTSSTGIAYALSACDAAQFVADVTIPDGAFIEPGATFVKTWRIKNVGTCTWNTSYSLVFDSGEKMGGPDWSGFPKFVSPGQSVDLSVSLTAPMAGGIYRGFWKLRNASGALFGIGTAHKNAFWVEIRVRPPTQAGVTYDFVANMCSGQWIYDGGPISCPVNNSKKEFGYVLKLDNPVLETGLPAGAPGLLTIPQDKFNGMIRGLFPIDDIFRGDRFQATVGCQFEAINCFVTYMLEYELGGDFVTLWKWRERYDGLTAPVDVDLTRIANLKNVRLVLTVLASGESNTDQPLWIAPRIVRMLPVPAGTLTPVPPTSSVPTMTGLPPPSGTGCDRAQFVSDVTVPDGTTLAPNASFSKTWRLKNVGDCTWTTAYSMAFATGDRMGGVEALLPETVVPGQTVDVGLNLTAPGAAGSYRGYWQLKNASGGLFGIGSTFDKPFWVDIRVSGPGSTGSTVLDFVSSVCSAQWSSGAGALPCPGTDGDGRGFVLNLTSPRLENGVTDSRAGLLTFPQSSFNGYIQGIYPAVAVQSGDRFQGTLNCEYGAADCFVIFRLDYRIGGGSTQTLGTFAEKYDGLYYPADIGLSSLAGQNVNFILTVLANGYATGDRALWVAPRIVRGSALSGLSALATPTVDPPSTDPVPTQTAPPADTPTNTPEPTSSVPPTATP